MRGLWTVAGKDVRQRLRDRSAYVIGVIVPMGLALLLGVMAGQREDVSFAFAYADQDGGPVADSFADVLAGLEADGVAEIVNAGPTRADTLIENGEVAAAFVIPDGFSDAVAAGEPAQLIVVANPADEFGTGWAQGLAEAFASNLNATNLSVGTVAAVQGPVPDPSDESLAARAAAGDRLSRLVRADGGSGVELTTHLSFGMAVFFLFFTVQFAVLGLIEERAQGTLTRLIAAPIRPAVILLGKGLAALVIGLLSVAVLVAGTSLPPLNAEWGNLGGVAVLTVAGVLAAVGVAALIGSFARTSPEAMGYMTFAAVLMGLVGSSFGPIRVSGGWLELASRLTPHQWLMDGYRALSVGQPLSEIARSMVVLVVYAAVTGGLGLLVFRTRLGAA